MIAAEQPEQGVDPENGKNADQKRRHADKGIEEDRVVLPVGWFSVGIEFGEERCPLWHFEQVPRILAGLMLESGSLLGSTEWAVWQSAQPATFSGNQGGSSCRGSSPCRT